MFLNWELSRKGGINRGNTVSLWINERHSQFCTDLLSRFAKELGLF